jgi:hypothetical protein
MAGRAAARDQDAAAGISNGFTGVSWLFTP